MSKQICEERNEVDEEPEEGEIQDDEGSLEDVSSDDEIPTIAKRQKSEVYARSVRLPHGQFAKTRRQQLSCTARREMRLCSSEKSDSALKKHQGMPRSSSRATGVHDSYFDGQRYKSSKELVQKVSGKVHEKENKGKDIKKTRRRSSSFHATGGEPRSTHITLEHGEPYFSSTSSKGLWHKCDVKEKHKKRKKNTKSNKTNNPLVEVYESQLKSVNDSSSIDTCVKSTVKTGVELILHHKEIDVEKAKLALFPPLIPSPTSSEIEILEVPVIKPEVITIFDSDEEVLKREKVENSEIPMTSVEKEDEENEMVRVSMVSSASKGTLESDDQEDNLILLREAALNSSKPEKCLNVNHDDEVLQLRLEALRSAVIRKYEERKKRGITLTKSRKVGGEKHLMSISPLGSPNPCSSGDSSLQAGDEVDPDMSLPGELNNITNYHDSDQANESEIDKISTIDMELAESDEEKEHVHEESGNVRTYQAVVANVESENSNCSKVGIDSIQRESHGIDILKCSGDETVKSALSQVDHSPSSVPAESLGYIIGDHELELDVVQEIQVTVSPPMQVLLDSQPEIGNDSKICGNRIEVLEKCEMHVPGQRHLAADSVNSEQIPDEEKQNYIQNHSISEETISTPFQSLEYGNTLDIDNGDKAGDCEIFNAVCSRSDCSYISVASGELDLESMIVLDEVGGCSDDAKSVDSGDDVSGSVEIENSPYADTQNNSENCDSEGNTKPLEENSRINFSGLLCTSRNSNDIVQSNSDSCEGYNTEMFGHVFSDRYASNSRTVGEDIHLGSSNLSVCESNLLTPKGCTLVESDVISSTNKDSDGLSLHESPNVSPEESCSKNGKRSQCEKMDVSYSNSQCGKEMRIGDSDSQNSVITNVFAIPLQESKLSSEENEKSCVDYHNIEKEGSSNSQQNADFCSSHVDTTTSPVHCVKVLRNTEQEENQCVLSDVLQQKMHVQSDANVFGTESVDNISSNQDNSTEDEETVLRVRLLAMLKARAIQLNNREKQETDSSLKSGVGDNLHESSSKVDPKKVIPFVPPPNSCVTDLAHVSGRNSEKDANTMPRQLSLSQSSINVQQTSSIPSVSKTVVYPSRNSPTVSRRGAKPSKHRIRNSKTHGRFNVNVPKLVINLGEDSDSGEDKSEPLESVSISNLNKSAVSEESKDNLTGSQSVPPDFEKRLDMLLKQARFQQEANTKEDKESLNENANESVTVSGSSKTVTDPSKSVDATVCKSLCVNRCSSSSTNVPSNTKGSAVIVEDIGSQKERNICKSQASRSKMLCNTNRVDVFRFSPCKKVETNKQDMRLRTKSTSTIGHASPTVPSVVDIGLLPSCKQKEYIRLKKQLAQLARKETGVKTKENITLVNTSRLLVKKNGLEEGKILANSTVRNTVIKDNIVVNTERSPFTRKFVRRGQGGTLTLRNEIGKSRRIVRTVCNSYNTQAHLRNRLTVTAPNRIASVSTEGSSVVRRVLCVPQKRIITAAPGAKKVSASIQITTSNINVNADDKQRKLLIVNRSLENAGLREKLHLQRKSAKTKDDENERHIGNSVSSSSEVQKLCIGKTVLSCKQKESGEVSMQSTVVVQQDNSNKQTTSDTQFQTSNIDTKNSGEKDTSENRSKLMDIIQEPTTTKHTQSVKRKKSISEHNDVKVRRKLVVVDDISQEEIVCSNDSNVKNADSVEIVGKTLAESLWNSECKLISKRYQVLEDIATVQMSLHKIQRVNEKREMIIKKIQILKEELGVAETQLNKEEELLTALYSEVENAKRDIMRKQSETLLLSVECEDMGGRVHGSNYNVPNSCTDLIRTGMGTVSKALEHLKNRRTCVQREMPTLCSSGEPLSITTSVLQLNNSAVMEDCSEDSSKQTPGSYSSPLEAIRRETESSSDNNAVLCPYHIMGSCKDKECSYLH